MLRRARIKASSSHLASLAGKRRTKDEKPEDPEPEKNPDPVVDDVNVIAATKVVENTGEDGGSKSAKNFADDDDPEKSGKSPKPHLKPRFRPNLSEADQQRGRLRRISGCESPLSPAIGNRVRTYSSGSDFNEQQSREIPNQENPGEVHPASPQRPLPVSPLKTTHPSSEAAQPTAVSRTRKSTNQREKEAAVKDTADKPANTVFDKRKAEYKKKFGDGVPDRNKMTMFDLIYYNPMDGDRMSNANSRRESVEAGAAESPAEESVVAGQLGEVADRLREEAVDNDLEAEEDSMPVPQVKVAPDGSIILDESSTLIETTAAKKAKEDLLKTPLVFENANQATNYGSWGKKKKSTDWTDKDTVKFYKALSVFGTDFSLMVNIFKKRTRQELKMKFKKEERLNRGLVDKCLSQGTTFDPTIFDDNEDEDEENDENANGKVSNKKKRKASSDAAKKPAKKRRKHRVKGRRYCDDSSGSDDEHAKDNADMPARSARHTSQSTEQSLLKSLLTQTVEERSVTKQRPAEQMAAPSEAQLAFPPGLLAANPGLANASPGSLVVVASPSPNISEPNSHVLQVFMVGNEETVVNPGTDIEPTVVGTDVTSQQQSRTA